MNTRPNSSKESLFENSILLIYSSTSLLGGIFLNDTQNLYPFFKREPPLRFPRAVAFWPSQHDAGKATVEIQSNRPARDGRLLQIFRRTLCQCRQALHHFLDFLFCRQTQLTGLLVDDD